jgi:multimeric flavodoxin WrbA
MVNLYDVNYKGCIGCLGCKLKGGNVGHCAIKDGLKPVLDNAEDCDAIILGSPIYLGEVTGELRSFIERLVFPYISYDKMGDSLFTKKIKTSIIFTTNCPEPAYETVGYTRLFSDYQKFLGRMFGECKMLAVSETLQMDDYDKYHMAMFDVPARRLRREEVFPEDCKKAYAIGEWAAEA